MMKMRVAHWISGWLCCFLPGKCVFVPCDGLAAHPCCPVVKSLDERWSDDIVSEIRRFPISSISSNLRVSSVALLCGSRD